ncbi:ImmA/IrrE family metallo-endopeptidase [Candidatus Chrysopegis kryptomonas]|uniref:IrrE N-terminal-like domain-containing protein n=1 Tax=Candidatus Chryseopegocella kryptomonas TaxID=1633643 RepID=A0A0P1MXV5_9BACT|nr:ImmA/IrrE family metallo-endopeptidase [Candidatus Chrysopegis kryptomonas]CUT00872.1 protein of unknown function (DUF955) [Candidatus Chrysopegis kryptomonas]
MNALAKAKARNLHEKYCISTPDDLVDIEKIANAEFLIVEEAELKDCLGVLVNSGDYGLIRISNKIKEPGQKRFVIAHEMGHFYNDRKFLRECDEGDIICLKSSQIEFDANEFAVEFLMREEWFKDFIFRKEINMELIKGIARNFGVSLSASAIRYAHLGNHPVAVILSKNGKVLWSVVNEFFPYKYIPRNYTVKPGSGAYGFFNGGNGEEKILINAEVWFMADKKFLNGEDMILVEENLWMKNYNAVLTIVYEDKHK